MKAAPVVALLLLAAGLAATAQDRGRSSQVPTRSFTSSSASTPSAQASGARSTTGQRTFTPAPRHRHSPFPNGVPPQCANGIFPLIPSAMGCTDSRFTGGPVNLHPRVNGTFPIFDETFPIYVPYPVAVETQPAPEVQEPEPPAPTIFEHRATAAPVRPASAAAAAAPHAVEPGESKPDREQIPTILIFRDGHQIEVLNYAIVGQTLYDLGTFVAHKIPLSDLNLRATIKANQDRGVEFSLPASTKVD